MDKQQMQKILIPAAAIAGVILLVGLIIATGGSGKPEAGGKGGPNGPTASGKFEQFPLDGPEWKDLPGGVKYWDVKEGTGTPVVADTKVTMHYTLWLATGERKQSSKDGPGQPFSATLSLGSLIAGWVEGVPGMKPGGTRRLFIPAAKGYAERGKGDIPPNADLVFEIELISSP